MECVNWLFGALSYTFPPMESIIFNGKILQEQSPKVAWIHNLEDGCSEYCFNYSMCNIFFKIA